MRTTLLAAVATLSLATATAHAARGDSDPNFMGLGTLLARPSQNGTLSRLLRGLAEWFTAFQERRAEIDQLSTMSDRDLADIGLSRALIHSAFDPEFARVEGAPRRAASDQEDRVLADLGLSRALPRPMAAR